MRCHEFEVRLNDLLDERIRPEADPGLARHARDCFDCAELLTGHQMLLDAVELLDRPEPQADFAGIVAADFNRRKKRQRARTMSWLTLASAAALLIAFGVYAAGRNSNATSTALHVETQRPDVAPVPNPPSRQLVIDYPKLILGDEQRALVGQMADGLKPVANSMSAALDALRRTFPGSESGARSS